MKSKAMMIVVGVFLVALFATISSGASSAPASASTTVYTVEDLGDVHARGINENGDVTGYGGWPTRAFIYTDADGLTWLPCNATSCFAEDLNDFRHVVGGDGNMAARWYPDGTLQDLGILPGGTESSAHAINNAGMIVGESYTGTGFNDIHAFVYTDADGMVDITPNAGLSRAYDVNEVGQVAGHSNSGAFRWEDGTMTFLGTLPGDAYSFGKAINGSGQVAGISTSASGNADHAFRFTDGIGMEDLSVVGEPNEVWGINQFGDVVGYGKTFGSVQYAFLYTDENGLQKLGDLIESPELWQITSAWDINDAGQIVVRASSTVDGSWHALRLTPMTVEATPTPTEESRGNATATPTATTNPEVSPTPTPTEKSRGNATATPTVEAEATATDTATATPTPTSTPDVEPTATPSPTATSEAADTVTITMARYDTGRSSLSVQATSTDPSAVLDVYVTATGEHIGTLSSDGNGNYRSRFSWPSNPGSVTVTSSSGGSDSAVVDEV